MTAFLLLWWVAWALRPDTGSSGRSVRGDEVSAAEGAPLEVGPEEGAVAPDFEAPDGRGDRLRLSDYRGQSVLLNFWATWCVACRAEMPAIQATLTEHRPEGFEVIAVNLQEGPQEAERFLRELGVDFHLALDRDGSIARRYGVIGLPASFFLDREGIIRGVWLGEMTHEMVEELAHRALRGAPAPEAPTEPVDLTVLLEPEGPGSLYLLSPLIRCDETYCARHLLQAVHVVPAVTEARWIPQGEGAGEEIPIFVRFDPRVGGPADVVAGFRRALEENPDPLHGGRLAVRYLRPVEDPPSS